MKRSIILFVLGITFGVFAQSPPPPTIQTTLPTTATVSTQAPVDIEFILDASGSMAAMVGTESQMDIAKKSIKETIATIPANVAVALRVYAHRIPKSDKEGSCKDTELLVPFKPLDVVSFSALVDSLKPTGYTPIAYSLKTAAQDFVGKESQHVIILVSDGEETCGGDPVAEAKNLLALGFKVTIHTIGFRVDAKTKAQLMAISNATGGLYFDAADAASLTKNLMTATQRAALLNKPAENVRGQEIRGGDQYNSAVPIQTGIEYRLDHHQKMDQYDYFYVDLKKGQALIVTLATMDKGIAISEDGKATEDENPASGVRFMNSQFEEIKKGWANGKHAQEEVSVVATKDEKIYLLIGSESSTIHKDSPFKITIKNLYDANQGKDVGDTIDNAVDVTAGNYPENWISDTEDKDFYRFAVKGGSPYSFSGTPKGPTSELTLKVYDTNRVQVASETSPTAAATVQLQNIVPQTDGTLYLEVNGFDRTAGIEAVNYSLNITGTAAAAPPGPQATTPEAGGAPTDSTTIVPTPTQPPAQTQGTLGGINLKDNTILLYGLIGLAGLILLVLIVLVIVLVLKRNKAS